MTIKFDPPPKDKSCLEANGPLTPKFDQNGLVTAIVQNAEDGEVVMLAHMNEDALSLTIQTGIAHYYSRSRKRLWKKGETSGNMQKLVELRVDCDQDAVLLKVDMQGDGTACHTGRKSCFYRKVEGLGSNDPKLLIQK